MTYSDNPLINPPDLPSRAPAFDRMTEDHYLPAIYFGIESVRKEIDAILNNQEAPSFENTIEAFEFAGNKLNYIQNVFDTICASKSNDKVRQIEETANKETTRFWNDILLDEKLFARIKSVYQQRGELKLDREQGVLLEETYKGFVRRGADLPLEQKEKLKAIAEDLSDLTIKYKNNTVKAAEAYRRIISDEAELAGVPERAKNIYRDEAKNAGEPDGTFLVSLEPYPMDIFTHCSNRALREELMRADWGLCYKDDYDNTGILMQIVKLRHESARIKGYETHADYVLADRMAKSSDTVARFLERNLSVYQPAAKAELQEIRDIAAKTDGIADLKPWDVPYYERILKEQRLNFETEALRPFFDLEKVLDGVRQHAENLFGIEFREETTGKYPVYHTDVKVDEVFDIKTGELIGVFYSDYYARRGSKRSGAWNAPLRNRGLVEGADAIPLVINNCNFAKPAPENPTLLSISDVTTVFHELGHALHGLLAKGRYPSLTGTNVKWDFVELPSQLMENWVIEPQVLKGFAHHYKTGDVIPPDMIEKVKEDDNFHAARMGLVQTFYGLLDMAFYGAVPSHNDTAEMIEKPVSDRVLLMQRDEGLRATTFHHIFSSEYAAGYYSYKWAEVLDADVFSSFKEKGLYDAALATRLRETVFSKGGTVEPMDLYIEMMGREPDPEAIFRREGLRPCLPSSGRKQKCPDPIPS